LKANAQQKSSAVCLQHGVSFIRCGHFLEKETAILVEGCDSLMHVYLKRHYGAPNHGS
jgi:hypothetical protein